MNKQLVFLSLVAFSTIAHAESLVDTCLNRPKVIQIQNSETSVKSIAYNPGDHSVTFESPAGKLNIDCEKAKSVDSDSGWKSFRQKTEFSNWDYVLGIPAAWKLYQNSKAPIEFHDDKEFPLRTKISIHDAGKSANIYLTDKIDPSAPQIVARCTKEGFSVFMKKGNDLTAIYENTDEPGVRNLTPVITPPPVPKLSTSGKIQDRMPPPPPPCENNYSLDSKSGKIVAIKVAPASPAPVIVPAPPEVNPGMGEGGNTMKKFSLISILALLIAPASHAAWSAEFPKTAVLKSFDPKCALFVEKKSNKALKLQKAALKGIILKSGETEISYISPEETKHLCVE